VLHNYVSLNCITVLPKHFYCCVLPYVYLITRVTLRAQVGDHGNSVQLMFAAIAERPELLGWGLRRPAVVGARHLIVDHFHFVL